MIQRIQSIYLLLILTVLTFLFSVNPLMYTFYGEDKWSDGQEGTVEVSILEIEAKVGDHTELVLKNSYLIYTLAASGLLTLLALFSFKNRKSQLLYCGFNYLAMAVAAVMMYIYILEGKSWVSLHSGSEPSYLYLVGILLPVFNFLAMRGIFRDEKLIRSMDRLR